MNYSIEQTKKFRLNYGFTRFFVQVNRSADGVGVPLRNKHGHIRLFRTVDGADRAGKAWLRGQ